jgi:ribosomal protein S18 acetylase RimI-like enzyme
MDSIRLKDGRIAKVSFLGAKDSPRELNRFINSIIDENAFIMMDRRVPLKEEEAWKKAELEKFRKKQGHLLIARVEGRIAGTSGAGRERGRGSENIMLGIAVAKEFRGIGLGEGLLRENIQRAKKRYAPRNIYLSVFSPNKAANNLYRKLGFKRFAVFPKWIRYDGKYIDHIFLKL